jgi:GntR family transcriptional regulator / MocR family aminotransferase
MPNILLSLDGEGPLNQRVYRGLRRAILDGRLPSGSQLPSTRALADELDISRNVVSMAFDQLVDEGYIEGCVGSGTFVSATLPDVALAPWSGLTAKRAAVPMSRLSTYARRVLTLAPLPPPGVPPGSGLRYDFRYGSSPVEDFPHDAWNRIVARRSRSVTVRSLQYGRARGFAPLRTAIARYIAQARGVVATEDQVVVVNGSQQAVDLVARLLLDPGDRVAVEEPCYQGARQVFLAAGARLVPTRVDRAGLDVSRLPRGRSTRLAYVTPSHQFPLGAVLPLARRLELLRWADAGGAHVLEDDYDSEFRYEGRPMQAVQGLDRSGRVLYVGTFSKVLFPALRLGYLVIPEPLVAAVASLKFLMDYHTPTFEQGVLADFMAEGHFERHLRRSRARHASRRSTLLEALREVLGDRVEVTGSNAGVHMVIWLRGLKSSQLSVLVKRAAARGLGLYPVTPYYLGQPPRAGLLLGYAGLTERQIREGVVVLGEVLGG